MIRSFETRDATLSRNTRSVTKSIRNGLLTSLVGIESRITSNREGDQTNCFPPCLGHGNREITENWEDVLEVKASPGARLWFEYEYAVRTHGTSDTKPRTRILSQKTTSILNNDTTIPKSCGTWQDCCRFGIRSGSNPTNFVRSSRLPSYVNDGMGLVTHTFPPHGRLIRHCGLRQQGFFCSERLHVDSFPHQQQSLGVGFPEIPGQL